MSDDAGRIEAVEWNERGCASRAAGDREAARRHFERARSLDPSFAFARFNLGEIARDAGDLERAEAEFREGLALMPAYATGHLSLARTLKARDRLADAEMHARRATELRPDDVEPLLLLASVVWSRGRYRDLAPLYREIVRLKSARARPPRPAGPRARLRGVTLCCVDSSYHDLSIRALRECMDRCEFDRALFLTDRELELPGIETVRTPAIASIEEYSRFLVKDLVRYVETPFVLLVQYDGYVLNASAWSDGFLGYDYIGARWASRGPYSVGNGGFSLRSRRLLEALQDDRVAASHPEDVAICVSHRAFLERQYGIRFAPPEIADRFSFEEVPAPGAFGFHGLSYLVDIVDLEPEQFARYDPARVEVPAAAPTLHRPSER